MTSRIASSVDEFKPLSLPSCLSFEESAETWSILSLGQFELVGTIARGRMGDILRYLLLENGSEKEVVFKTLCDRAIQYVGSFYFTREVEILNMVHHKNIVKTLGMTQLDRQRGIVLEYLPFGSYTNFFKSFWKCTEMSEELQKSMIPFKIRLLGEIVDAMDYLHRYSSRKYILHLDLTCNNILLTNLLHAKICDFGSSMICSVKAPGSDVSANTSLYAKTLSSIAQESNQSSGDELTTKYDIYSFGLLIFTVLADSTSYSERCSQSYNNLSFYLSEGEISDLKRISDNALDDLIFMMQDCRHIVPSARPEFRCLKSRMTAVKASIKDFEEKAVESSEKIIHLKIEGQKMYPSPQRDHVYDEIVTKTSTNSNTSSNFPKDFQPPPNPSPRTIKLIFNNIRTKWFFIAVTVAVFIIAASLVTVAVVLTKASHSIKDDFSSPRFGAEKECEPLSPPMYGHIVCKNLTGTGNSICFISCDNEYVINGNDTILCIHGNWSEEVPSCAAGSADHTPAATACEPLRDVEYANISCSDGYLFGSTCLYTCVDSLKTIQGSSEVICSGDGKWSDSEPICVCSDPCLTGNDCLLSSSWSSVEGQLDKIHPYLPVPTTVVYGGSTFVCTATVELTANRWDGTCKDLITGDFGSCGGYGTSRKAIGGAAAELLRIMVSKNLYPVPCDRVDYNVKKC